MRREHCKETLRKRIIIGYQERRGGEGNI